MADVDAKSTVANLLTRHNFATVDLATELRALGDCRVALIQTRKSAWDSTGHLNITERREAVTALTADKAALVAEVEGNVEALRVELAGIEFEARMGGHI